MLNVYDKYKSTLSTNKGHYKAIRDNGELLTKEIYNIEYGKLKDKINKLKSEIYSNVQQVKKDTEIRDKVINGKIEKNKIFLDEMQKYCEFIKIYKEKDKDLKFDLYYYSNKDKEIGRASCRERV